MSSPLSCGGVVVRASNSRPPLSGTSTKPLEAFSSRQSMWPSTETEGGSAMDKDISTGAPTLQESSPRKNPSPRGQEKEEPGRGPTSSLIPAPEPKSHERSSSHDDLLRDLCREVMDDPSVDDGGYDPTPGPPVNIPVLPSGRLLKFLILSTWGDPNYVGLAGVDLFDGQGELIRLPDAARQVHAIPEPINALPEYGTDPRTVDKLFDGVNLTRDDLHVWLSPFDRREKEHSITVSR